jgi:hypothetical protein
MSFSKTHGRWQGLAWPANLGVGQIGLMEVGIN